MTRTSALAGFLFLRLRAGEAAHLDLEIAPQHRGPAFVVAEERAVLHRGLESSQGRVAQRPECDEEDLGRRDSSLQNIDLQNWKKKNQISRARHLGASL